MFDTTPTFALGPYRLPLDRVHVMGILNLTPDSFSDGGAIQNVEQALAVAAKMHQDGASIIDIGGESTRPGAASVSVQAELDRVLPAIERIAASVPCALSIDTRKPEVMRAAVAAGAGMINDVYALRRDGALDAAAALGVPVVLMHMQGEPGMMQAAPDYQDVVEEVARFLTERIFACQMAGIDKRQIIVDPGFGFGKRLEHNIALLAQLRRFTQLETPVLAGFSRKASIGELTLQPHVGDRLAGSLAAHLLAAQRGARIIRTHDVRASVDMLRVLAAVPPEKTTARTNSPDLTALFG
jgi:dihydropteroate synthase